MDVIFTLRSCSQQAVEKLLTRCYLNDPLPRSQTKIIPGDESEKSTGTAQNESRDSCMVEKRIKNLEEVLQKFIQALQKHIQVNEVVLFGSYGRG